MRLLDYRDKWKTLTTALTVVFSKKLSDRFNQSAGGHLRISGITNTFLRAKVRRQLTDRGTEIPRGQPLSDL